MRTVLLVAAGHGMILGAVQVSAAARFTGIAGMLYAALSAGSLAGAVTLGTRLQSGRPAGRLAALTAICGVVLSVASVTTSPIAFATALVALGACLGPAGVIGFGLVGRLGPDGRTVEAFTMLTATGLGAIAVGAGVAGVAVDRFGPAAVLLVAGAAAIILTTLVIARRRSLPAAGEQSVV
ncbi:hypothetical protein [Actinoplanes sp. NPDC049265]|uniref:hypothetical protein n=1 Tax=Actinoplanes sp. NPDC049265 TaxID=3363902 RepID=UPI0037181922